MKKWIAILVFGATAISASAGYLGENLLYVDLSYDELNIPGINPDGWSTSASLNFNVLKNDSYGIDLSGGLAHGKMTLASAKDEFDSIFASATFFLDRGKFKPFIVFGIDYYEADGRDAAGVRWDADGFSYGVSAGIEYNPTDVLTLSAWVSYSHDDDSDTDSWTAVLDAIYWVQEKHGIGGGIAYSHDYTGIYGSYTFKF